MGQSEERVGEQFELKIFSKSDTIGDCGVYRFCIHCGM